MFFIFMWKNKLDMEINFVQSRILLALYDLVQLNMYVEIPMLIYTVWFFDTW